MIEKAIKNEHQQQQKIKRLFDCISFHFASDFISLWMCVCVRESKRVHRIRYDISARLMKTTVQTADNIAVNCLLLLIVGAQQ